MMLRMLNLALAVTCTILLPGAARFDDFQADPEASSEIGLEVDRGVPPEQKDLANRRAEPAPDESAPVARLSAIPLKVTAARWIVTLAVANDIGTIKAGDMVDLLIPAVGDATGLLPDAPGPSDEQVLQGLPAKDRAGRVTRDKVRINVEQLVNHLDQPRHYPLVGVAQLHSRHFKCTVRSRRTTQSDSPGSPDEIKEEDRDSSEVVYIDLDRLISPVGGKLVAENVQVVGTTHDRGDRLLIAVTGPQVLKLKTATSAATLFVRPRDVR